MTAHERLGLRPGASPAELRAAWRRAATATHPDLGGDPRAFAAASEAYRQLLGRGASRASVVTVISRPGPAGLAARWWRRRRQRATRPRVR